MQYLKFTRRLHKVSIVFNMAAQALLLPFSAPICICCLAVDAISKVFGNIFKLVQDLDTKLKLVIFLLVNYSVRLVCLIIYCTKKSTEKTLQTMESKDHELKHLSKSIFWDEMDCAVRN